MGPYLIDILKSKHQLTIFNRGYIKTSYTGALFVKGDRNTGFNFRQKFDVVIDMCAYAKEHIQSAIEQLDFEFFVNLGTVASYKKTDQLPFTGSSPLGEWPLWGEYNKGKVECERTLENSGINYASIRPVYILGPANYCDRENFIYSRIKKGAPLKLPGDGLANVQFVFADEVARLLSIVTEQKISGAFNCAGDDSITLKGLVEEMASIVGKKAIVQTDPVHDGENFDISLFPFANEPLVCDNSRAKSIGMTFKKLAAGLKSDYANYYSKNI